MRAKLSAVVIAALLALTTSTTVLADANHFYVLSLTRVGDDAFRDQDSGLVVVTTYCYEYVYDDNVVYLDTPPHLIFPDGEQCDVSGLYRPGYMLQEVSDDLYKDTLGRGYVRTMACAYPAVGEPSVVLQDRVIFVQGGQSCERAL